MEALALSRSDFGFLEKKEFFLFSFFFLCSILPTGKMDYVFLAMSNLMALRG